MTDKINELNNQVEEFFKSQNNSTDNQSNENKPINANEQQKEPPTNQFNWDELNKNTESEFKSFDDIKSLKTKASEYENKIKEYEPIVNEHKTIKQQLAEYELKLKEANNPLRFFGNKPEKYIQVELENKYPDKESLIPKVMKANELSDIEVLILNRQWKNPKGTEAGIKSYLSKIYDTDIEELSKIDPKEWDEGVAFQIQEDAREARERLGGIPAEIKLPESQEDLTKQQQLEQAEKQKQNLSQWESFVGRPEFENSFDEISYYEKDEEGNHLVDKDGKQLAPYFVWKVEPEFKKQIPDLILNVVKSNNLPLTQEVYVGLMENLIDVYEKKNRHKIDREKEKSWRAKWDLENDNKLHVPKKEKEEQSRSNQEDDPQRQAYYEFGKQRGIY